MIHIDLFSGIGGFSYAADQVWDDVEHIFCEIDPFCVQVLKKHWKGATIYGDIRQLTADAKPRLREQQNQAIQTRGDAINSCFILTGGFPCQPFSQAGKRRGTEDDRFLWPEMLRVIKEFKPAWIIGENVAGILSMAQYDGDAQVGSQTDLFGNKQDIHTHEGRGILYGIIEQLGEIGYAVQTFVIPACAVNAPHRRDRVWIVAHRRDKGLQGSEQPRTSGETEGASRPIAEPDSDAPDTRCEYGKQGDGKGVEANETQRATRTETDKRNHQPDWSENWIDVAIRTCSRGMDDGLPARLYKFRVERLKALGNAIVPAVAVEIMRAIKAAAWRGSLTREAIIGSKGLEKEFNAWDKLSDEFEADRGR